MTNITQQEIIEDALKARLISELDGDVPSDWPAHYPPYYTCHVTWEGLNEFAQLIEARLAARSDDRQSGEAVLPLGNMHNSSETIQAHIRQSMPNVSKELVALMTSPSIDECVNRFLGWKLPKDFDPDGGINFNKLPHLHDSHEWPVGTNLFTAIQAKAMFEYVLSGATVELAAPQQAIPSGWKLVPIEPTDEMKEKGWEAYRDSNKPAPYNMLTDAYKAMLTASPTAPIESDK
jgi:hypothetical protein